MCYIVLKKEVNESKTERKKEKKKKFQIYIFFPSHYKHLFGLLISILKFFNLQVQFEARVSSDCFWFWFVYSLKFFLSILGCFKDWYIIVVLLSINVSFAFESGWQSIFNSFGLV